MSLDQFEELLNQSTDFSKLEKDLKGNKKDYNDTRFYKLSKNQAGNGSAIIRFLPQAKGDELPFVEVYNHSFKNENGQWFVEECPSTIGKDCPVCAANKVLWDSGIESNKTLARTRKRQHKYISNILVIQDKTNPENEGKVFLFKYGNQIMDKITEASTPAFDTDPKINAFHFKEGANFRLVISKKDIYDTYEKSTFESQTVLFGGDVAKIKEVWEQQHSLKEFTDPTKFKSYEEIQKRFARFTAVKVVSPSQNIEEELASGNISVGELPSHNHIIKETESLPNFDLDDMDDMESFKSLIE